MSSREITGVRVAFAVSALIAIGLGTILLVWTTATLSVIAVLFGLYFLVSGALRIVRGIGSTGSAAGGRVLNIVFGLIMVIVGIIAMRNPDGSLAVLGLVIGISWIVEGIAALVEYSVDSSRWFGILFGVVAIIAGVIVLFAPVETLGVLVTIGGIMLIISGLVQLVRAFTFGRGNRAAENIA
ncbi:HdeD family acid-resistance protein [Cryobacterium arcticum]|nr:DUF308 domain-containing protein [Cryobacterium arcticum]